MRIGILGAAWIVPDAILKPCNTLRKKGVEVTVEGIACRDRQKAEQFARKHKISKVFNSYEELISDSSIDLVYIPLPNGLHHKWAIKALQEKKHVLCEKPFASNAEQAREMIQVAKENGMFIIEAFHYRFHPFIKKMGEIVHSGSLGKIESIEVTFNIPVIKATDIRYNWDLGGGALMDTGSYSVNFARFLAGCGSISEEPKVISATPTLFSPKIDKHMNSVLSIQVKDEETSPLVVSCNCSIRSWVPKIFAVVKGTKSELNIINFVAPHFYHSFTIADNETKKSTTERNNWLPSSETTYLFQLETLMNAIRENNPELLPYLPEDAIANMQLMDDIYVAAGLPKRE